MRNLVKALLLAEAFAVTTFGLGWWSVPIVAALWAAFSTDPGRARMAALCAAGGWATLLLLDAVRGPVGLMASQLGVVMHVPAGVLYVLTLVFPALLAWSAATLAPRFRGRAV
ncbi:MAG: hypothetical protein Q7S20_01455 [Gemmatimonadaceae bacterium]|nr:hypothetical protein [Gemmatimonadaceae bacterium]